MGDCGAVVAVSAAGRRAGLSAGRHAGGAERRTVDSAHRGAVAGVAGEVSAVPDRARAQQWVRSGQLEKALRA
jgi:hypothetical protein